MEAEPQRILLGQHASDALTATGEKVFVLTGKASHPDDPSRWVIHLVPSTIEAASNAIEVATGRARAVKPKAPKS